MKKIIFIIFISVLVITAQERDDRHKNHEIDKYEQLEKIKLIELLNLDEQATLKLFAKRNESRNRMKEINDKLAELTRKISANFQDEKSLNDSEAEKYINQIKELERKHHQEREKFISSLNEILNKEQILKYIVFESRFRDEVRKKFFNRRSKRVD